MLRISSAGVIRSYRSGLMRSRINLENARQTASDFKAFRSFADNPAAATRSFKLIRSYGKTDNYIQNSKMVTERLDQVWSSMMEVSDLADKIDADISTGMNGDKDLDSRQLVAKTIRGHMESMVQSLNAKYNDDFLFGGQETGEPPFTMDENYNLYYRGINVDTGIDQKTGKPAEMTLPDGTKLEGVKVLEHMAGEKLYVDIGLSMKNNNGGMGDFTSSNDINMSSAMDVSMPGINVIGFGKDDKGNPKNAISQLRDIANELEKEKPDLDKLSEMRTRFGDTRNDIRKAISTVDTRADFVKTNTTRLEKTSDSLYTQISDLTEVDPALAYTNFAFAQSYYNSALKIGNSILDQSFIDFMK